MLRLFIVLVSLGVHAIRTVCRSHADLVFKFLALQQQVAVLKKERPHARIIPVLAGVEAKTGFCNHGGKKFPST